MITCGWCGKKFTNWADANEHSPVHDWERWPMGF